MADDGASEFAQQDPKDIGAPLAEGYDHKQMSSKGKKALDHMAAQGAVLAEARMKDPGSLENQLPLEPTAPDRGATQAEKDDYSMEHKRWSAIKEERDNAPQTFQRGQLVAEAQSHQARTLLEAMNTASARQVLAEANSTGRVLTSADVAQAKRLEQIRTAEHRDPVIPQMAPAAAPRPVEAPVVHPVQAPVTEQPKQSWWRKLLNFGRQPVTSGSGA